MSLSYYLIILSSCLSVCSGTLIIVTDDAQWSYEVRGSYPSNSINHAAIKSKVDSNRSGAVPMYK